jgi:hypothetical protein
MEKLNQLVDDLLKEDTRMMHIRYAVSGMKFMGKKDNAIQHWFGLSGYDDVWKRLMNSGELPDYAGPSACVTAMKEAEFLRTEIEMCLVNES